MVQTDAEYAAFPLHWDTGTQAIQRPAVEPPPPPRCPCHDSRRVYPRSRTPRGMGNRACQSIGRCRQVCCSSRLDGFAGPHTRNFAPVLLVHGLVTAADLAAMKAALLEKLASPADFPSHVARFAESAGKIHLEEPIARRCSRSSRRLSATIPLSCPQ
jgi:hypothetical protein